MSGHLQLTVFGYTRISRLTNFTGLRKKTHESLRILAPRRRLYLFRVSMSRVYSRRRGGVQAEPSPSISSWSEALVSATVTCTIMTPFTTTAINFRQLSTFIRPSRVRPFFWFSTCRSSNLRSQNYYDTILVQQGWAFSSIFIVDYLPRRLYII